MKRDVRLFDEEKVTQELLPLMCRTAYKNLDGYTKSYGLYIADKNGDAITSILPRDHARFITNVVNRWFKSSAEKKASGKITLDLGRFSIRGEGFLGSQWIIKETDDGQLTLARPEALYDERKHLMPSIAKSLTTDPALIPYSAEMSLTILFHMTKKKKIRNMGNAIDWVLDLMCQFGIINGKEQVAHADCRFIPDAKDEMYTEVHMKRWLP